MEKANEKLARENQGAAQKIELLEKEIILAKNQGYTSTKRLKNKYTDQQLRRFPRKRLMLIIRDYEDQVRQLTKTV